MAQEEKDYKHGEFIIKQGDESHGFYILLSGAVEVLILAAGIGLFGYQESLAVPYAETSLAVEFTGAVVLMVAAVIALIASLATRRSQGQSF